MKIKVLGLLLLSAISAAAADKFTLEDFDYSISGTTAVVGGNYVAAFWGDYVGGVFTPLSGVNNGYFALSGDDSLVNYSATNNNNVLVNRQLYLAIYDVPNGTSFASISDQTAFSVLTDTNWLAPALSNAPGTVSFEFGASTVAVKGAFSTVGVNNIIVLATSAIPEPSSFAALAGLAVLGAVATRRRRSV